jgi:hypothetical protein
MLVTDNVRKCVAFIYFREHVDMRPAGTAFFVGIAVSDLNASWNYVVTAKHVLSKIRECSTDQIAYLRINLVGGGSRFFEVPLDRWVDHPDDPVVDVAVVRVSMSNDLEYLMYPAERMATQAIILSGEIGIGDEVFITGLFVNHFGRERNIPIVRIGNIAAMPEEPVNTGTFSMEAYLIEARSVGGLSGSPVFVNLGVVRRVGGDLRYAAGRNIFYLLGLIHGHWDVSESDSDVVATDVFNRERINMGIAIVIPAAKILEVINQSSELASRAQVENELRRQRRTPSKA